MKWVTEGESGEFTNNWCKQSLLGLTLSNRAIAKGYKVYAAYNRREKTYRKPVKLNINNYKSVEKTIKAIKPNVIIYAAALTDVD